MWQFLPKSGGYHPNCAVPPVDPSLPCRELAGDHSYPTQWCGCGGATNRGRGEGGRVEGDLVKSSNVLSIVYYNTKPQSISSSYTVYSGTLLQTHILISEVYLSGVNGAAALTIQKVNFDHTHSSQPRPLQYHLYPEMIMTTSTWSLPYPSTIMIRHALCTRRWSRVFGEFPKSLLQ